MNFRKKDIRYQVITYFGEGNQADDYRTLNTAKREALRRARRGYRSIIMEVAAVKIAEVLPGIPSPKLIE